MRTLDDGRTYVELTFRHDEDCESPLEYSDWSHIDFRRHHGSDPRKIDDFMDEVDGVYRPKIWLRSKLRAGTAFLLDRYTHGGDHWYLHTGRDLPFDPGGWDTSRYAGLLLHEGGPRDAGRDRAEREKRAEGVINLLNEWLSGACYGYIVEGLDGCTHDDSLWGLIGYDNPCEAVLEQGLPDERPLVIVYADEMTEGIAWAEGRWGEGIAAMTRREYEEMIEEREEELDAEGDKLAMSEFLDMAVA